MGVDSLTRQGQGLGEPHEGYVIVILVIRVVAVDDDLGDGGCLGQLVQVVGAHIHLPALQDLLLGPARATESMGHLTTWQSPLAASAAWGAAARAPALEGALYLSPGV